MKNKDVQVTIYPIPAPKSGDVLYEAETLEEICFVCEKLFLERWPLHVYNREQVDQHFRSLEEVMSFEQHMEISIAAEGIDWEQLMQELAVLLPQFAWIRCSMEPRIYNKTSYYIAFVPITIREIGFPFDLQLQDSIAQQLFYESEEAVNGLCHEVEQRVSEKEMLQTSPVAIRIDEESVTESAEQIQQSGDLQSGLDNQLLLYREEIKRDKYAKERMRIANEKLEMMMEKLELAMMHGGLNYFDETDEDDEHWDKRLRISLREYSYLMQKAKYLEQMWRMNGELIKKTEKMTVSGNQLIYERDQVNQVKEAISASDIYLVLDECRLIESRVKINNRPWFRKPNVRMMKMDYDSLVSKAAYFDLLQGESYLLEKLQRDQRRQLQTIEEAG